MNGCMLNSQPRILENGELKTFEIFIRQVLNWMLAQDSDEWTQFTNEPDRSQIKSS